MEQKEIYIKYVANYLRKSRGESEEDLIKHQYELQELCKKNNWTYVEYMEIESGDSIALRPVFQQLLKDVEEGLYDAVCVVDIDRLGRGDQGDQDRIKKTFLNAETWVVTPQAAYDLSNENDEFTIDMKAFIARMEYKQIVKRLTRGKKVGAKLGRWTNGTPPFPYEYERWKNPETGEEKYNPKGLVVNDDNLKIYRYIIESAIIDRKNTNEIAWDLNKKGILSPRKTQWRNEVIRRILLDEVHLGKIISNKTQGDAHKRKKPNSKEYKVLPRDQWTVVNNCHEAVKTIEEHEQILMFLGRKTKSPRVVRKKEHPLADLVKCGVCGHTLQVVHRDDRKTPDSIKPCWFKNGIGEKCGNSGGLAEIVYNAIDENLSAYEKEILRRIESKKGNNISDLEDEVKDLKKRITAQEKQINFIYEQFEKGIYKESMFVARRDKAEKELEELQEEFKILELRLKHLQNLSDEERLQRIQKFREGMKSSLTAEEKNELYKSIIENIIWTRSGSKGNVSIKINFL